MTSISSSTLDTLFTNTSNATDKASGTYNQFLNLLTTQLQHQDPLDPMDSSKFTDQLVSFSQVEQGILTNQKLDALLTQNSNTGLGQSLAYIGKDVYYKGDVAYNDGTGETTMKIGYAINGNATQSKLHITDKDGNLIRTIQVPPGTTSGSVEWDGKNDDGQQVVAGNYKLAIDALDSTGKQVDTYTAVPGRVDGIESVDGVLYLALKGDARIDSTTVLSISNPDDPVEASVPDPGTGTNTNT